jgi:hypothetical protein
MSRQRFLDALQDRPDTSLENENSRITQDRVCVLAAVRNNGLELNYAWDTFKGDREVVLAAVQQDGRALLYAYNTLKRDKGVVLAAVRQDGLALEYAKGYLREDRDVVLAAIAQNGQALQFAGNAFKNDKRVVMAAVEQNFNALQSATDTLKRDEAFVVSVVHRDGRALRHSLLNMNPRVIMCASAHGHVPSVAQADLAYGYAENLLTMANATRLRPPGAMAAPAHADAKVSRATDTRRLGLLPSVVRGQILREVHGFAGQHPNDLEDAVAFSHTPAYAQAKQRARARHETELAQRLQGPLDRMSDACEKGNCSVSGGTRKNKRHKYVKRTRISTNERRLVR